MKPNDRVAYNHKYLKAVQADKDIADMRGTVVFVKELRPKLQIVKVLWDGELEPKGSISINLCKVASKGILDSTE